MDGSEKLGIGESKLDLGGCVGSDARGGGSLGSKCGSSGPGVIPVPSGEGAVQAC